MYWSWKGCYPSKIEAIKSDVPIFSLDNMDTTNALAIAMCWSSIKLTWTAPIAIATIKIVNLCLPFSLGFSIFAWGHRGKTLAIYLSICPNVLLDF
jgi:hypothetical protein